VNKKEPGRRAAKKTLLTAGVGTVLPEPPGTESFLLLFFKKEALSFSFGGRMFSPNSRYYKLATYTVTLPNGTQVIATRSALPNPLTLAGYHRRIAGDRLDQLAARFLKDPTLFWQLCDSNNTPAPDALAACDLVGIPVGPNSA